MIATVRYFGPVVPMFGGVIVILLAVRFALVLPHGSARHGIAAFEPAAKIDIGAMLRAEGPVCLDPRLTADRTFGALGRSLLRLWRLEDHVRLAVDDHHFVHPDVPREHLEGMEVQIDPLEKNLKLLLLFFFFFFFFFFFSFFFFFCFL